MCFQSVEVGGFQDLETLVKELVNCLNSLSEEENLALNSSNEVENDVIQVLAEILKLVSSPQMDQVLFGSSIAFTVKYIIYFAHGYSLCYRLL